MTSQKDSNGHKATTVVVIEDVDESSRMERKRKQASDRDNQENEGIIPIDYDSEHDSGDSIAHFESLAKSPSPWQKVQDGVIEVLAEEKEKEKEKDDEASKEYTVQRSSNSYFSANLLFRAESWWVRRKMRKRKTFSS